MAKKADGAKKRKSRNMHSQKSSASISKGSTKTGGAGISKGKTSGGIGKILAGKGCILPILTGLIIFGVIIIL